MSHFTVGIIVPNTLKHEEIHSEIERLMAPFDENIEAPEYPGKCWCVGTVAEKYGQEVADREIGTWDAIRKSFHESDEYKKSASDDPFSEEVDNLWKEYIKEFRRDWDAAKFKAAQSHSEYQKPRHDCESCNGTGTYMTTYNPKSQWDWYRVGGRWDGSLIENPRESENGFNFSSDHEQVENNSVSLDELVQRWDNGKPFTFLPF